MSKFKEQIGIIQRFMSRTLSHLAIRTEPWETLQNEKLL